VKGPLSTKGNKMIQSLFLQAFKSMICVLLCQFCDCCEDEDNCPDGICNDLRSAIADLEQSVPPTTAVPQLAAPRFNFNWDEIQPTIEAITAAVKQLIRFFGAGPKVGS
jgi:hypothetical protein